MKNLEFNLDVSYLNKFLCHIQLKVASGAAIRRAPLSMYGLSSPEFVA